MSARSIDTPGPVTPSKAWRIADWGLRIVIALAFLAAGSAKLAGAAPMVQIFTAVGIGQWFRFVTGALEISGGLLVILPRTSVYGAALLTCVMVGALLTHAFVIGGNPVPAAILLALNLALLWLRRRSLPGRGAL